MIILDYSGIAVASIFAQRINPDELNESFLRHLVLNSIRMYNVKFKNDYGQIYIACDHSSWRKKVFEYYKANRKTAREQSDMNWTELFDWLGNIRRELDEFSPYKVLHVEGAEADDIIATLVQTTQDFGKNEKVMIISSDKDFLQLQKYKNVYQFSSVLKKPLVEKDPQYYLFEHIVRGDSGDGVPNIFSDDDTFVTEGKRQTPISSKKLKEMYQSFLTKGNDSIEFTNISHQRNFHRNQKMIDLSKIPESITEKIMQEIQEKENKKIPSNTMFMNYLIQKRCTKLISSLTEFF
jgi:5'-3' exonuclease